MRYSKKRGVSTVISVVLLASFVIILGLIITGWSTRLVSRNIEKGETRLGTDLECLNVEVKLSHAESGTVIFVENNNLKDKELRGFISRFDIGTKIYVDYKEQDTKIDPFGVSALDYSTAKDRNWGPETVYNNYFDPTHDSYDPNILKHIEVIPQIELESGEVVDCVKSSAEYTF
tara:strand:- start:182 stop:706 length:525 start_codon:yes stop_codon:yes gene_type:complete